MGQGRADEGLEIVVPAEPHAREVFTGKLEERLGHFLTTLGRLRAAVGAYQKAEEDLMEADEILSDASGPASEEPSSTRPGKHPRPRPATMSEPRNCGHA